MMEIICNGLEDRREKNEWKNVKKIMLSTQRKRASLLILAFERIGELCFTFLLWTSNKMLISFLPLVRTDFTSASQQEINKI